jgi:peptidoglycan hydrolase CwlO-like protein
MTAMNNTVDTAGMADIEVFSDEERNEINARIEAASAREPVAPPRLPARGGSVKRGIFPILVNVAALLVLGGGLFFLYRFHQVDTVEIRESNAVLGITERALIREIRQETDLLLSEKESAIDAMNVRIAEVDAELSRLDSLEALTDEQRSAMAELQRQQDEYRGTLTQLQTERARIVAEARIREAETMQRELKLRAQAAEQQIDAPPIQSMADIESARNELALLSGGEEKAALVERLLSGYYAAVTRQIGEGQYREASETLSMLKEFLNTPSFQSLRSIQIRRESDAAAVNTLAVLIAEARKAGDGTTPAAVVPELPPVPPGAGAEAALRQQLAEQSAALAAREAALAELQKNYGDLQSQDTATLQALAEREQQIESLQAQNNSNLQKIETLQRTISNINAALEDQ